MDDMIRDRSTSECDRNYGPDSASALVALGVRIRIQVAAWSSIVAAFAMELCQQLESTDVGRRHAQYCI